MHEDGVAKHKRGKLERKRNIGARETNIGPRWTNIGLRKTYNRPKVTRLKRRNAKNLTEAINQSPLRDYSMKVSIHIGHINRHYGITVPIQIGDITIHQSSTISRHNLSRRAHH